MHSFHKISLPLPPDPHPLSYYGCLPNRGKKSLANAALMKAFMSKSQQVEAEHVQTVIQR
jgi:hypothetical protein